MSWLEQAEVPEYNAFIATIVGDGGVGKTTLAATWPKPFFLCVEDGLQSIPKENRPKGLQSKTVKDFWEQLMELVLDKHEYKTVVIDSVTRLERLFMEDVVDSDPKKPKSINQALGGWGAGRDAIAAMHNRLRKAAEILKEKGINTVFLAHADINREDPPDSEGFTKYNMRLHDKSMAPYKDDVDLVGFLKLQTFAMGDEGKKKAISDGTRVLITYFTAANVSKNRYGITEDLIVEQGKNPLVKYIQALNDKEQ